VENRGIKRPGNHRALVRFGQCDIVGVGDISEVLADQPGTVSEEIQH